MHPGEIAAIESSAPALFSTTHVLLLLGFALGTIAMCILGKRARGGPAAERLDRGVGFAGLAAWLLVNAYWWSPGVFAWKDSLPIHICDLAAIAAPLAMLTNVRAFRAIAYFWGIGLSTQGLITPATTHGPEHLEYWVHWLNHMSVIGIAIYDVAARGFRPRPSDLATAIGIGLAYIAAVLTLNILTGFNYGYVGDSRPDSPTIIDALGPWPLRIIWIVGLGITAMCIAYAPWGIVSLVQRQNCATQTVE